MRNYWKSHDFENLSDQAAGILLDAAANLPDPASEIFVAHAGGQMARVAADATAFALRSAHFIVNVHTRWSDPARDGACIAWARKLFDDLAPHASGSVYVNFMPADETGRLEGAYRGNMERLARINAKYDPGNLFRVNHNIAPAAG